MATERLSAADAFEILGDDVRLGILRVLDDSDGAVSFSELRAEVGVRDSGRFNYHLDRLRGHFIRKGEDGYELRYHGRKVVRTVLAGSFTDTAQIGPFSVRGSCYDCEGALEGVYEDERVTISCRDCGERILSVRFPPSGLQGRDPAELMGAYERWSRAQVSAAADGVCLTCSGATEKRLVDAGENLPFEQLPAFECLACTESYVTSFAALALDTSVVEGFYADHGIDLEESPYWDIEPCVTGEYTTIASRDPLQVEVTFPVDDERLVVTLDETLTVVRTVRTMA